MDIQPSSRYYKETEKPHKNPIENMDAGPIMNPRPMPRRFLLRIGNKYFFSIVMTGAMIAVALSTVQIMPFATSLWVFGVATILLLVRLSSLFRPRIQSWVAGTLFSDIDSRTILATTFGAVLTFAGTVLLAPSGSNLIAHVWPLLLPPMIMYAQWSRNPNQTLRFLILSAILAILVFASSFVFRGAQQNDFYYASSLVVWLSTFLFAFYFLFRKTRFHEIHADALREVLLEIGNFIDPAQSLTKVVSQIGGRLGYDRVFALLLEEDDLTLRVVGGYGVDRVIWEKIAFPSNRGITGHVVQTKESEAWDDVNGCEYYYKPDGFQDTKSEAATPILAGDKIYGALDIQSTIQGAYVPEDLATINTLAKAIGQALQYSERLLAVQNISSLLNSFRTENELFEYLADSAQLVFGADKIVLYRLAIGTGYPILPPFIKGKFEDDAAMRDERLQQREGPLIKLIKQWQFHFSSQTQNDETLIPPKDEDLGLPFIIRETVKSMCFLPIGSEEVRLGALFLNYTKYHDFKPAEQLALIAFSHTVAAHLLRARHLWQLYQGFAQPQLRLHNLLGRHGLGKGMLRKRLTAILERANPEIKQEIEDIANNLESVFEASLLSEVVSEADFTKISLEEALAKSSGLVKETFPECKIIRTIEPRVEKVSPELKLVLYSLSTEAINNALINGRAKRIEVEINLTHQDVILQVENDGENFDPNSDTIFRSRHGIFDMLDAVKQQLKGEPIWDTRTYPKTC